MRKRIVFKCHNMAVVDLLRNGSSRDRHFAFLLRELVQIAVLKSFTFIAVHIPGARNTHADWLSRFKFEEFCNAVPTAASSSLDLPPGLLNRLLFPPWMQSGRDY